MDTKRVKVTYGNPPHTETIQGVVQSYNLEEFRRGVDPVLSVRCIPGRLSIDLYKSQVISVDEIEGGI